jgi:outer membrane protein assembly factor BamA
LVFELKKIIEFSTICITIGALAIAAPAVPAEPEATSEVDDGQVSSSLPGHTIPDIRDEDLTLKAQSKKNRNFFIVPIPMSSPTFGTGLVLGGAYYYPQTAEQKEAQPASFTGAAIAYTDNKSWAGGVMQQNYFADDKWRFNAVAAYADFRLELVTPEEGTGESLLDWLVEGGIFQASIDRRIAGNWFLGASLRYLDIQQDLDLNNDLPDYNPDEAITSPGLGFKLEYDSRDVPSNPYQGRRLEVKTIFAEQKNTPNGSYQSYYARFRSYHLLSDPLVLAWEVNACWKDGRIPLWDTCRLTLRGFPITRYLSMRSIQAQAEVRWNFHKRWGVVAFAGAGRVKDSLGNLGEGETIPSYGVGLRWMVLKSQRINVRVDYARSDNGQSAWYLSVAEAF